MLNVIGFVTFLAVASLLCQNAYTTPVAEDNLKEGTFDRVCENDYQCNFQLDIGQVFLSCSQGKCQCKNPEHPVLDVANYPVQIHQNDCVVSYNAPCGTSNGLTLVCEEGKSCIEGRCRSELRSTPLNHACNEDIDCEVGLKCVLPNRPFSSSYCQKAD